MIVILTAPEDVHADYVCRMLGERGAEFLRFNPAQFPVEAELTLAHEPAGQVRAILHVGAQSVDLESLRAVWFRRPEGPVPHTDIAAGPHRNYVEEECRSFLEDAWTFMDCLWLPGPRPVIRQAEPKARQLKVAGELGFELPPTLFTNSPAEFLEFYRRHKGKIISKLASCALQRSSLAATFGRYTEVVSPRQVGYAAAVRYCPMIFQAYVPKRVELRITVVGQQVFAAEIHSQQTNHTRHDWRRYDFGATPYLPHDLPAEVADRCVRLVERLGLCFGTIDLVLTPDGRYVFLEINPNGQYLWIEQATGLPISDAICNLLIYGPATDAPVLRPLAPQTGDPS